MEGLEGIKVTNMGENLVMLQSSQVGGMVEALRRKREWWEANFAKVIPWSPNLVAKRRRVWVKCRGGSSPCVGREMF